MLFVGRPAGAQPESTVELYPPGAGQRPAQRTRVALGRSSVNTIEVKSGLSEGDRVVLSDMSAWDASETVRLDERHRSPGRATRDARPGAGQRLLHLEGVTKVFLTDEVETHALSNVHMTVHQGEWVAIVGPSGSGKTTLLAILGLLDTPSSGNYLLDGRRCRGSAPSQRA